MILSEKVSKRFYNKVIKTVSGCWEWTGKLGHNGYGVFGYKYKTYRSHRFSWKMFKGEIPEKMYVLHKCDNRKCVNPEHLFLGTQLDNMRDMWNKKRNYDQCGENSHRSKFKQKDIDIIRYLDKNGIPQKKLAFMFRTREKYISNIVRYNVWKTNESRFL